MVASRRSAEIAASHRWLEHEADGSYARCQVRGWCCGAVDAQLLVQCVAPSAEIGKRVGQRQDFAARSISSLAGPDGDPVAKDVRILTHLPPDPNPCQIGSTVSTCMPWLMLREETRCESSEWDLALSEGSCAA